MSIHVAITRRVREGHEAEFEEKLLRFAQQSLSHPGTRGVQVLRPAPDSDSREFGILRSFASVADRDSFYQSALFKNWESDIRPLVDGAPLNRQLHGLEEWFRDPTQPNERADSGPPPKWKMALVIWVALLPQVLLLRVILPPLPYAFGPAISTAIPVALLTWVVMPLLTRLLRRWLHPHASAG